MCSETSNITVCGHKCAETTAAIQQLNCNPFLKGIHYRESGGVTAFLSMKDWDEKCKENYQSYFGDQRVICYPPLVPAFVTKSDVLKVMVDSLTEKSNHQLCLFSEFRLYEHLELLSGSDYSNILNQLSIIGNTDSSKDQNQCLLFHHQDNCIFLMNFTEETDQNLLWREMDKCSDDMKVLLAICKRHLATVTEHIIFLSAIIAPNMTIGEETAIFVMIALIIDQDSISRFKFWWKDKVSIHCKPNTKKSQRVLDAIIASVYGGYTMRKINTRQGDLAYMQLTYQQVKVLSWTKSNKKLIFGGYGCGKSVVGTFFFCFFC